jgi:gas vesicle protein
MKSSTSEASILGLKTAQPLESLTDDASNDAYDYYKSFEKQRHAQGSGIGEKIRIKREEIKESIQSKREEIREKIEEKKEEIRELVQQKVSNIFLNKNKNLLKQLTSFLPLGGCTICKHCLGDSNQPTKINNSCCTLI